MPPGTLCGFKGVAGSSASPSEVISTQENRMKVQQRKYDNAERMN